MESSSCTINPLPIFGGSIRSSLKTRAVLAGNVFKVLVSVGEEVSEGQSMLVVEAMKMEMEVTVPRSGTIIEIFVREGDVIKVGDPLVSIG